MRRSDRQRLLVVAALLLGAAGCGSDRDVLEAETLTVGHSPSADFPSISGAVGSARAGATIHVEAGTYVESVVIEKSVTLIGAGGATIVQLPPADTSGEAVIQVRGAVGVRIQGLTVQGPADGFRVRDSRGVVITNVVASGNGDEGMDVQNSRDVEISGTFDDNLGDGIQIGEGSARVTVHSSTISEALDGVKIQQSSAVTVHSSTISVNIQDGVKIESSADCIVRDNDINTNGDDGILVGESTGARLLRNSITNNFGRGIRLRASPDTVLEGNTFSGNVGGDVEID